MLRLEYTPRALQDLQNIKEYIDTNYGTSAAQNYLKKLTKTARQLEQFPEEGIKLSQLLAVATDYHYLVIKPNYLFYRPERDKVKVIRVLNEKPFFLRGGIDFPRHISCPGDIVFLK